MQPAASRSSCRTRCVASAAEPRRHNHALSTTKSSLPRYQPFHPPRPKAGMLETPETPGVLANKKKLDAHMTIGTHARIETKRAAEMEIDDFRNWSVAPRFRLIGVE